MGGGCGPSHDVAPYEKIQLRQTRTILHQSRVNILHYHSGPPFTVRAALQEEP